MPHILKMEQRGINLDGPALYRDVDHFMGVMDKLDTIICEHLGKQVDVDSGRDLAHAIKARYPQAKFNTTPKTGEMSTSKDSLMAALTTREIGEDYHHKQQLLGHLLIRGSIATCLRTFMQPWLTQYKENNGRLFMKWNQIRNYTDTGARTGRLSSSPNLQNIPVEWEELFGQLESIGYQFDPAIFAKDGINLLSPFLALPRVRQYILPEPGWILLGRDYAAQEMKLLAHFTAGKLMEEVVKAPRNDIHLIAAAIAGVTRKVAKTMGFAILYGAGAGTVAEKLNISYGEATSAKARYLEALPEIKVFSKQITSDSAMGKYTPTLGDRLYAAQPSKFGRSFDYKVTNYKIQGSAADQTKAAMYAYCTRKDRHGELILSVHDQLVVQVPEDYLESERPILEDSMHNTFADRLKCPILSDESYGLNFAEMVDVKDGEPMARSLIPAALIAQQRAEASTSWNWRFNG
jgi:DNA polymerase-1